MRGSQRRTAVAPNAPAGRPHQTGQGGKHQACYKTSSSPAYESGFSSGNSETSTSERFTKTSVTGFSASVRNCTTNNVVTEPQKNEEKDSPPAKNLTHNYTIDSEVTTYCNQQGSFEEKNHGERENTKKNSSFDKDQKERQAATTSSASINCGSVQKKFISKANVISTSSKTGGEAGAFSRSRPRDVLAVDIQPMTVPLLPLAPTRVTTHQVRAVSPSPGPGSRSRHPRAPSAQQAPVVLQLLKPNNQPVSITKIDMDRQELREWPSEDKITSSSKTTITSGGGVGSQQRGGATVLSLQSNHISKICGHTALSSVVLLDLYHNKLSSLHGLALLPALRVLLVAKNRLTRLDGLAEVVHLEVLDLHGNQLQHLHGLSALKKLRVLNAAGNLLREVSGLRGLDSLLELNLRRNLVRSVSDLHYLPRLQKLFLAHNEIFRYEDMSCVQGCLKLKELSLHHNPLSRHGLYFYAALTKFYRLKRLDEREIDLEMRKTAERMLQKAKDRDKARSSRLHSAASRANAICSARDNWNRLRAAHKRFRTVAGAAALHIHNENDVPSNGSIPDGASSSQNTAEMSGAALKLLQHTQDGKTLQQTGELKTNYFLSAYEQEQGEQIAEERAEEMHSEVPQDTGSEGKTREAFEPNTEVDAAACVPLSQVPTLGLGLTQAHQGQTDASISTTTIKLVADDIPLSSGNTYDGRDTCAVDTNTRDDTNATSALYGNLENVVGRNKSSPNLLVTQATLTEGGAGSRARDEATSSEGNAKNIALARSVSCWNLVLTIKTLAQKAHEVQASDKVSQVTSSNLKPRLKKQLIVPDRRPLRKSASSRSLVSLPEHRTMERLTESLGKDSTGLKSVQRTRPKTANFDATKRLGAKSSYDKEISSSSDSLSSSSSSTNSGDNPATTTLSPSPAKFQNSNFAKAHDKPALDLLACTTSDGNKSTTHKTNTNVGNTSGSLLQPPPLTHRHSVGSLNPSKGSSLQATTTTTPVTGLLRQQGKNYLAEIDSGMLNLYGQGALNCIDLQWDRSAATSATTAKFQYINFDEAITVFSKLRVKFPKLQNFMFEETHLARFNQLNALAELHQVRSLTVGQDGNPIVEHPQWRYYAVFRLTHWGLMVINGKPVSEEERQDAMVQFAALSQLAFVCLPRDHLTALMVASKNKTEGRSGEAVAGAAAAAEGACTGLGAPHLQELIGKEALQYRQSSADPGTAEDGGRGAGRRAARRLLLWSSESVARLSMLDTVWPTVMHDMARDALADFSKPNYGKLMLDKIKAQMRVNK